MDADRFDALVRSLPRAGTRRRFQAGALGGVLGLFGLDRLESTGLGAPKKCKGLKGKKKKKCLKKINESGCRNDADCPDKIELCRNGKCEAVCGLGSCTSDCEVCLIRYEVDGDRRRQCADLPEIPALLTDCATDDDCPQEAPLCISFAEVSCTEAQCGTCAVSIPQCAEPECQNDGDCTELSESCQGGQCFPVCPSGACPGCGFCTVRYQIGGARTQVCADTVTIGSPACTTDSVCEGVDTCVLLLPQACDNPPCRICSFVDLCP